MVAEAAGAFAALSLEGYTGSTMTARHSLSPYDALRDLLNEASLIAGALQSPRYRLLEDMGELMRLDTLAAFRGVTDADSANVAAEVLGRRSWRMWGQVLALAQELALELGVDVQKTLYKLGTRGWTWLLEAPKDVFQFVPVEVKMYVRASAYVFVCLFKQMGKEGLEADTQVFEQPVEAAAAPALRALGNLQFLSVALRQQVDGPATLAAARAFWHFVHDLGAEVLDDKDALEDAWAGASSQHVLETTDRWYTQQELDALLDGEQAA